MVKKLKSPRRLMALAVFAIVAMSAFGFAASNTINNGGKAGDGYGQISGYNVTNVHYTLKNGNDELATVTFTLDSAANSAKVGFSDDANGLNATGLANCSVVVNNDWTCNVGALHVTALNAAFIRVVAAG
ncbi:MAG: hypothetical protein AB7N24_16695 [Dehalococcoidia bacterium]